MQSSRKQDAEQEASSRLLCEGAKSYVEANAALEAYRHEVQKLFHDLIKDRIDELSKALGLEIELSKLKGYHEEWEGTYAWVGLTTEFYPEFAPNGIWVSFGLNWDINGSPPFGVFVGIGFGRISPADQLWGKLSVAFRNPQQLGLERYGKEIFTLVPLSDSEGATFSPKLEQSLDGWIHALRKIGGVKAALV
ncbi:MAG TPA: hypothetical protein VKS79_09840 [Gemmataceae bacterium]|nr:hypothetical protein [Gemmataceae bacterium]